LVDCRRFARRTPALVGLLVGDAEQPPIVNTPRTGRPLPANPVRTRNHSQIRYRPHA
jgi:hypothetical protein